MPLHIDNDILFSSKAWFDIWMETFGGNKSGFWIPKDSGTNLLIPYCIVDQKIGWLHSLCAKGAINSHTPRYDIIGEINDYNHLTNMMLDLDVSMLEFPYLSKYSKLTTLFNKDSSPLIYHIDFCESSPYINCKMDWQEYWKSRGRKTREDWSRHEKKLLKKGIILDHLTKWEEIDPILSKIFAIEASGWKGRKGSAIIQDKMTRKFYTYLIREWSLTGYLNLFVLKIENELIAFQLCTVYNGALTSLKIGYLEEYSKESPGQVLQLQILRWAFNQPDILLFDMCGPSTETKLKWATHQEDLYTLRIFRKSPKGFLAWSRLVAGPYIKSSFLKTMPLVKAEYHRLKKSLMKLWPSPG